MYSGQLFNTFQSSTGITTINNCDIAGSAPNVFTVTETFDGTNEIVTFNIPVACLQGTLSDWATSSWSSTDTLNIGLSIDGDSSEVLADQATLDITCTFVDFYTVGATLGPAEQSPNTLTVETTTSPLDFKMEFVESSYPLPDGQYTPLSGTTTVPSGTGIVAIIQSLDVFIYGTEGYTFIPKECTFGVLTAGKTITDAVPGPADFDSWVSMFKMDNIISDDDIFWPADSTDLADHINFNMVFDLVRKAWLMYFDSFIFFNQKNSEYSMVCSLEVCLGSELTSKCNQISDAIDAAQTAEIPPVSYWQTHYSVPGTLVMKIGRTNFFSFSSAMWESDDLYNENADSTTEEDAKFSSYLSQSFNKIVVCLNSPVANCYDYTFTDGTTWSSAKELFSSGYKRLDDFDNTEQQIKDALTNIGIGEDRYQSTCAPQRPGFNVQCNDNNHVRFGYCANFHCQSCQGDNGDSDGSVGIGIRGQYTTDSGPGIVMADGSLDYKAGAGVTQFFSLGEDLDCTVPGMAARRVPAMSAWIYVDLVPAYGDLIMKIGKTTTFHYGSTYWESDDLLNENADATTEEDAKFSKFLSQSFNKMTVCFNSPLENCWSYTYSDGTVWNSAKELFSSGHRRISESAFADTKQQIADALSAMGISEDQHQSQCPAQKPGFNSVCADGNKVRFGYCANFKCNDCKAHNQDADGVVGIGIKGQYTTESGPGIEMANGSFDFKAGAGVSQFFSLGDDLVCTVDAMNLRRVPAMSAWVYVDTVS